MTTNINKQLRMKSKKTLKKYKNKVHKSKRNSVNSRLHNKKLKGGSNLNPNPNDNACSHHTGIVYSASFSPDGLFIVTASIDKTCKIWNVATGKCMKTLEGHTRIVYSASFSPDGKLIVSASIDKTCKIWNVATGKCMKTLEDNSEDRRYSVYSASFSPDGRFIMSVSYNKCKIWNVAKGKYMKTLRGHKDVVRSASFSPDGKLIVSASDDTTCKIWNVATGKCMKTLEGHTRIVYSASFSPDGLFIVTASDDTTCKIWNVSTGDCIQDINDSDMFIKAIFSPNGELILTLTISDLPITKTTCKIWSVNKRNSCSDISSILKTSQTSISNKSKTKKKTPWYKNLKNILSRRNHIHPITDVDTVEITDVDTFEISLVKTISNLSDKIERVERVEFNPQFFDFESIFTTVMICANHFKLNNNSPTLKNNSYKPENLISDIIESSTIMKIPMLIMTYNNIREQKFHYKLYNFNGDEITNNSSNASSNTSSNA